MSKKIKLSRSIRNASDSEDIEFVTIKDESEISAFDFFDVTFSADGSTKLGSMAETIANLTGLTYEQVGSLHIKDYTLLSAEVGKYIA